MIPNIRFPLAPGLALATLPVALALGNRKAEFPAMGADASSKAAWQEEYETDSY